MSTCAICCNEFRSTTSLLACPSCPLEACFSCVGQYLVTQDKDADCMGCKKPWDRAFLYSTLPQSLLDQKIKPHRADVLMEREKALLPVTQECAALYIRQQNVLKSGADLLAREIELKKELKKVQRELDPIRQEKRQLDHDVLRMMQRLDLPPGANEPALPRAAMPEAPGAAPKPARTVVTSCPRDECRGFVFSDKKACDLCQLVLCMHCHKEKLEEHTCDPNDVETIRHLRTLCRNCPKCQAPSVKVDGCSQVYCVQCNTAWNWNTGEIDHGIIHAPDYFAYMRRIHGRVPAEGNHLGAAHACGGHAAMHLRDVPRVVHHQTELFPKVMTPAMEEWILSRVRVVGEMQYLRPPAVMARADLRVQYLTREIDEAKWKRMLHMREKAYTQALEITRLKQAYRDGMRDILNALPAAQTEAAVREAVTQMRLFHDLMDAEYTKLSKRFKSKARCPF